MTKFRANLRIATLLVHVLSGVLTVLLLFPFLDMVEREKRLMRWAGRLLRVVGVQLTVKGRPPVVRGSGALIVANHVSWLDIYLIHSRLPARFISKAEIRNWPVIGWLADRAGRTLFIERSRKADTKRVNGDMAGHLRAGECLALFPEGTTTDGAELLPFYGSLFQPAVEAEALVWPALIRYLDADGQRCDSAAYYGDMSLLDSLRLIVQQPTVYAEITFLEPIVSRGLRRRELAAQTEQAIRALLVADGRDSPLESADRRLA
jgi:1-acyl-sn-glycerol-3-phosphate acyltransferase